MARHRLFHCTFSFAEAASGLGGTRWNLGKLFYSRKPYQATPINTAPAHLASSLSSFLSSFGSLIFVLLYAPTAAQPWRQLDRDNYPVIKNAAANALFRKAKNF